MQAALNMAARRRAKTPLILASCALLLAGRSLSRASGVDAVEPGELGACGLSEFLAPTNALDQNSLAEPLIDANLGAAFSPAIGAQTFANPQSIGLSPATALQIQKIAAATPNAAQADGLMTAARGSLAAPESQDVPSARSAVAERSKKIDTEISALAAAFSTRYGVPAISGTNADFSGRDVTAELTQAKSRGFSLAELEELRNKTVLVFVGGFLSNYQRKARLKTRDRPSQYFEGVGRFADSLGIAYRASHTNTSQSAEKNVARLVRLVEEEAQKGRHVIFVPQSHGAIDVLRALEALEASPAKRKLLDNVSWIPIQGPFFGAPGADQVVVGPYRRLIFTLLEFLGGSRRSILEMTTEASLQHYQSHEKQIQRILKRVPTIAVASYLHKPRPANTMPGPWGLLIKLKIISQAETQGITQGLDRLGIKSDGLVPFSSQFFSGMEHVVFKDFGHFDSIVNPDDARSSRLFAGLLHMILSRHAQRKSSVALQTH